MTESTGGKGAAADAAVLTQHPRDIAGAARIDEAQAKRDAADRALAKAHASVTAASAGRDRAYAETAEVLG